MNTKEQEKAPTPEIDAWCELAMSADVSAVLELAKDYERKFHVAESQIEALESFIRAECSQLCRCADTPESDGFCQFHKALHRAIRSKGK